VSIPAVHRAKLLRKRAILGAADSIRATIQRFESLEERVSASIFTVRAASHADVPELHAMIRALAEYEKLTHLCIASESDLSAALFGRRPAAEALIAWADHQAAGFALYFHNFSTFLGRRGLWLEDLFVRPAFRRQGCARTLLRAVAAIAVERNCGRFEWTVLDWNAQAIDFYRTLGASVLADWRIVRVVGPALAALAGKI
jgi:GNAT superfamily N-acetyltransferase